MKYTKFFLLIFLPLGILAQNYEKDKYPVDDDQQSYKPEVEVQYWGHGHRRWWHGEDELPWWRRGWGYHHGWRR